MDAAEDTRAIATFPAESSDRRPEGGERRELHAECGLDGSLHRQGMADRAEVQQRPLDGGDGDRVDDRAVPSVERLRLVDDEAGLLRPPPSRAEDLLDAFVAATKPPQRRCVAV